MYLNKGGIIFVLQGDARCPMRLITYNQVKVLVKFFLCLCDNVNGLIGRKNDYETILMKFFSQPELTYNVRHPR